MKMEKLCNYSFWSLVFAVFLFVQLLSPATGSAGGRPGLAAAKESRRRLAYTEAGEITTVDVGSGRKDGGSYHLEFFTLDTGSLFLPVLLHTDMIFYVQTGRGNVSWIDKKKVKVVHVEEGDIYRLEQGTVLYIQSSDDPNRIKLRIHAIFNTWDDQETLADSFTGGAYSSVADLVRGFDVEVLKSAFGASADVIEEIARSVKVPPIIPFGMKNETESNPMDWREGIFEALSGRTTLDYVFRNKKNDEKAFNILKEKPDVENRHGWSTAVTHKEARSLKGSSMGVFMVNLTEGSMIGPHWNPRATEIAIVVKGHGMVQVVMPSDASGVLGHYESSTKRFYVKEGDVFVVPRFHPMAQISFQNSSFVFVGFSNNARKNHPQFLAGKWSVLRTMKKEITAASFNMKSSDLDELLSKQNEGVLLGCDGCAEEVKKKMDVEIKREEEEKRREEEEEKRREEAEKEARKEEEEKQRKEEEEAKKREEEEEQRKKEEARKKEEEEEHRREEEEEAKKREEEEARKREEEEHRREEEEEAKKREEEEEHRKKEEEEEARKREEEEEARKREEEEHRREEEEEAKKREEEEQRKKEEEEEAWKREEEEHRREEEEEAKKREEEEEQRKKEEEEEARKREEEEEHRKEEEKEAKKREEEQEQRKKEEQEEARKREEEEKQRRKEEEEKGQKREEEEEQRKKREEEKARKRKEEEKQRRKEEDEARKREEDERREEEEHRREKEEEAKKREEEKTREEEEEEAERKEEEKHVRKK